MSTPKIGRAVTTRLRELLEDYEVELTEGDYAPGVRKDRYNLADDFVRFLEGRFSPATEKGKRRRE